MPVDPSDRNRKPVYEGVREQIQQLILEGTFRGGQKLPGERTLAENLHVSRNSVREALRLLEENDIVRTRHGDGTYVCSAENGALVHFLNKSFEMRKRRVREIFEFRRILEPQIAWLAAHNISRREVDGLKVLIFDQQKKLFSGEEDSDLDEAFHLLLAKATKNAVIVEVMRNLTTILNETRSHRFSTEERKASSLRTHILIVDALEKRDPEAARRAMEEHLQEVEQAIFGTGGTKT
ncbi:MAG TPA: FadR/GntR family transcriptional regulator [Desulfomonilaceae bacterium]|nr:FadR/GntR family transcriptional regulator [Desulfomonilaceae bacterium]